MRDLVGKEVPCPKPSCARHPPCRGPDPRRRPAPGPEPEADRKARMKWWTEARFGLFIHWGLYALPARHEWVKSNEKMSDEAYAKYFARFDPDLYDPRGWARAAREAGMKYFVVTTKHHDGFCLWDSKLTDYKSPHALRQDLIKPLVEAMRAKASASASIIPSWTGTIRNIRSTLSPMRDIRPSSRRPRPATSTNTSLSLRQVREL